MKKNNKIKKNYKCVLCGSQNKKNFLESPKISSKNFSATSQTVSGEKIVRCQNCGLISVFPLPTFEKVSEGYSKEEEKTYIEDAKGREISFSKSLLKIKKYKQNGSILDVGCAAGFFLKAAKSFGYKTEGIEPNKWMTKWAKDNLSLKITNGSFEKVKPSERYDIITFWDVLEHMIDPKSALVKAKSLLKEEGILLINYPNINSFPAKIFGKNWWFIVSGHLYYFSPKTIKKLLSDCGFRVLEDKIHFQSLSLPYLVSRLGRYNLSLASRLSKIFRALGFSQFLVPYYAGQNTVVAIKE